MITTVFKSGLPVDTAGNVMGSSESPALETFTVSLDLVGSTFGSTLWQTLDTQPVWVADAPAQVIAVTERHEVVGSTTGMLVKAWNRSTLGSSAFPVLASTIDHTAAADTTRYGTIINSTTRNQLAQGDALGWMFGALSNQPLVGMVTVTLQRI